MAFAEFMDNFDKMKVQRKILLYSLSNKNFNERNTFCHFLLVKICPLSLSPLKNLKKSQLLERIT